MGTAFRGKYRPCLSILSRGIQVHAKSRLKKNMRQRMSENHSTKLWLSRQEGPLYSQTKLFSRNENKHSQILQLERQLLSFGLL